LMEADQYQNRLLDLFLVIEDVDDRAHDTTPRWTAL
jgi:hypothetical protein